ncbi:MAG TPA: hypothetical protein VFQ91_19410 [Bryobacteraceae bacterium]|nr:hypothetical protein [Bryobacteraceae bacterium]
MIRAALWILSAAALMAGSPLLCEMIEIGQAKSLPWKLSRGWQGVDDTYSLVTLQTDTLSILTPTAPVPLRMETIRRAALYSAQDPAVAERLAIQLLTRVLDSQAAHPSAWFDAGYFVASLRQASHQRTAFSGVHPKQWVRHAIELGGKGMENALARIPE